MLFHEAKTEIIPENLYAFKVYKATEWLNFFVIIRMYKEASCLCDVEAQWINAFSSEHLVNPELKVFDSQSLDL